MDKIRWFEMAILCVYLPKYSITCLGPAKGDLAKTTQFLAYSSWRNLKGKAYVLQILSAFRTLWCCFKTEHLAKNSCPYSLIIPASSKAGRLFPCRSIKRIQWAVS